MMDLEYIKEHVHDSGVCVNKRVSLQIPQEPRVFPDYGKGFCVYCGKPLPPYKRKYCCDNHGWHYRSETAEYLWVWWPQFRDAIIARDKTICGECKVNTQVYNENMRETKECPWEHMMHVEVHHIVPLHNGGLEFDPDNCITLCTKCHKAKHSKRNLEPTLTSSQSRLEVT